MIVWHAMDRHVQLHNGNLMIEASTTFLFESVLVNGRWKRKISHDHGRLSYFRKEKINYTMLITNRVRFLRSKKRKKKRFTQR